MAKAHRKSKKRHRPMPEHVRALLDEKKRHRGSKRKRAHRGKRPEHRAVLSAVKRHHRGARKRRHRRGVEAHIPLRVLAHRAEALADLVSRRRAAGEKE